jgi:putative endonuclease
LSIKEGAPEAKEARKKGWSLYIAECADGSFYTGIAKDVEKRIQAHNAGKGAKYTATRGPVKLLFQEPQGGYSAALRREYQVKRLPKKKKILFAMGEKLRRPSRKSKMSFQKDRKPKSKVKRPRRTRPFKKFHRKSRTESKAFNP